MTGAKRDRAFTLLETLLALSTFAALTVLIAAMLAQTRAWTQENALPDAALRPFRVESLLREQLSARAIVGEQGDDAIDGAVLEADALRFYTSTPALLPDAGIVRASYVIEREARSLLVGAKSPARASLALVENRVLDVAKPGGGLDTTLRAAYRDTDIERRHTVLSDCSALAFEALVTREKKNVRRKRAGDPPAMERVWIPAQVYIEEVQRAAAAVEPAAGRPASKDPAEPGASAAQSTDSALETSAPAVVRLVGSCDTGVFVWVFNVTDSRSF